MDQLNSSRLRRRSVRNLRRSSSFFGDSHTASLEVEQEETPPDDGVASTYGSIWVEDGSKEKGCFQQVVNCSEEQLVSGEVGSCVLSKCLDDPKILPVFSSYSGLTNEFLDSDIPVILNGCQSQERQLVQDQELCNQQTPQLDEDVDCGNETHPHVRVTSVSVYNSTNHLHDGIHQDKAVSSQNDVFCPSNTVLNIHFKHTSDTMFEQKFCKENSPLAMTENTKNINTEVCDDKVGGNFKTLSTNYKCTLLGKEEKTNFTGKLQTSDLNTDSIISAESRKDRRKSECDLLKADLNTNPDYEPKKRKRLSLKKSHSNNFDERKCTFVGSCTEKDIELKLNENVITEVLQETYINVVGVTSNACTSQQKDCKKGTENPDNLMDLEISEVMLTNFDAELYLSHEKVATKKKNKQSKSKATRRSSRYFNLCEMPLIDFSLEQVPNVQLLSPEIKDFAVDARSPKFSSCEENKENISEKQLNASPRKSCSLEDDHELLDSTIKLDDFQLLDVAFIEEVVEDFANLCVNEKTSTGQSLQATRRRSGKRHSGAYTTIDSCSGSCQGTEENTNCAQISCQQNDIPGQDISLKSALECSNNLSSATDVKCDLGIFDSKRENIFNGTGDSTSNGEPHLYLISSTSNDDVDMDELPSPDSQSAKDELPPLVNSESKMCMRVRRSRKSWGMCPQNGSNEQKKTPRQKKTEKQSLQTLVTDDSQTSASTGNAKVSPQPSDIKDISCETNRSTSSSDDEESNISPGLLCLYKNKNFVMPQPRSWETIKESPKCSKQIFSKQRRKCFVEFENGRTNAKLQRRRKKALDMYSKIGWKPVVVTNEEFERKMLDAQLFVENL